MPAFEAGADEVDSRPAGRRRGQRPAERDAAPLRPRPPRHPSTRLPGAVEIEAEIEPSHGDEGYFATCYADLDHFKEFNDRYSYYEGDRVIRMLARILHDVVKGMCGEDGFVGHIGGDDFIFIIPLGDVPDVCDEIVSIFDTLIPVPVLRAGSARGLFLRQGSPWTAAPCTTMTVSIGVVTNEKRRFTHAAQVSALATEMKSYAKTLPGSVYSIDRRTDAPPAPSGGIRIAAMTSPRRRSERFLSRVSVRFPGRSRQGSSGGHSRAVLRVRRRGHRRRRLGRSTRSLVRSRRYAETVSPVHAGRAGEERPESRRRSPLERAEPALESADRTNGSLVGHGRLASVRRRTARAAVQTATSRFVRLAAVQRSSAGDRSSTVEASARASASSLQQRSRTRRARPSCGSASSSGAGLCAVATPPASVQPPVRVARRSSASAARDLLATRPLPAGPSGTGPIAARRCRVGCSAGDPPRPAMPPPPSAVRPPCASAASPPPPPPRPRNASVDSTRSCADQSISRQRPEREGPTPRARAHLGSRDVFSRAPRGRAARRNAARCSSRRRSRRATRNTSSRWARSSPRPRRTFKDALERNTCRRSRCSDERTSRPVRAASLDRRATILQG